MVAEDEDDGGVPAIEARSALRAALDDRTLALAVVGIGFIVRLGFAFTRRNEDVGGDAYYFHNQANLVADGHGFLEPLTRIVEGIDKPAAAHPPLYSTYLALWSLVGVRSPFGHMLASVLLGTVTVALVLVTGRRLAGPRVGLLAGLCAALHPNLWIWDGMLLSETAAATTVALFLWCVVRMLDGPTAGRLVAVGAAAGLAALTRSELALLGLAVLPLASLLLPDPRPDRGASVRRVAAPVALAFAALVAVIIPWSAYNQTRFVHPVPLSTGAGLVLVSSNCESTYSGPLLGYWDFECSVAGASRAGVSETEDASEGDQLMRADAVDFAQDNADRLPIVAAARLGRVTGLFRPFQQVVLLQESEGLPGWVASASMGTWYLLAGLAIVGVRTLRRAGVRIAGLVAPVVVVLVVAVAVYGIWRFRAPGDVAVCLLAGVGADALIRRHLEGGRPLEGGLAARAQATTRSSKRAASPARPGPATSPT